MICRITWRAASAAGRELSFPDRPRTRAIGYIPEVEHTYAYMDADYGIVNEHGLMMGECTDMSAHLPEAPFQEGGGIFYASELSRVALERCRTAREAVELMGALVDEYGLWGSGETLAVADREEAWVFEMQMSPTGKGGFWIAEKIPDGDFFIETSQFRIRGIREGDPNQIFNPNLPQMLKEVGWAAYDGEGRVDWVKSLQSQEFYHPYYSKRRVWRGMNLVAPSKNLPSHVGEWDEKTYPFSIRPDKKLNVEDVARIHRDYYQGTEFDKSKSPLAGMYGSPYHYEAEIGERSILSSNTSYTHIAQVNDALPSPMVWMSMNTPYENPFIPFAVSEVPEEYRALVKQRAPKSPTVKNTLLAFLTGGAICTLGQLIRNGFSSLGLPPEDAGTATSAALVLLAALATGAGLYTRLARFAGAGTLVPITGFANAVAAPAVDFRSEGWVTGTAVKMFTIAGPVIVYGVSASVLYGAVLLLGVG